MADFGMPTLDQKLFLVISVAIATVSFFINIIQVVIFMVHDLLHNVRNTLLLSQAVSGLVTTFTIVYPIKLVTSHPMLPARHDHNFFNDFAVCYFVASGFLLFSIFSYITNFTVMVLEQYLCLVHPRRAVRFQTDFMLVTACITIAWVETVLIAMAPWLGWNDWNDEDCHIPEVWPLPFTALVAFLFFVHLGAIGAMFVKIWLAVRRRSYAVNPDSEELPVTCGSNVSVTSSEPAPMVSTTDAKLRFIAFIVLASCHIPIMVHLITYANCNHNPDCVIDMTQKKNSFMWTSLLLIVNAVVAPLIYIFTDEHLTKATIWFLKLCCCPVWCRSRHSVSPIPG